MATKALIDMNKNPFVPGETQTLPYTGGGSVVLAQASGEDSGYTGTEDNPQGLTAEGALPAPTRSWEEITRERNEQLGISVPNLESIRSSGQQINPEQLGQGIIDQINQNNSLITAEQVDASALASQYDNLISQLQGQYRLAETEEEKQRLRYMLADIEAQYDAAKQTISQTYQLRRDQLASRIDEEKASSLDYAQRAGDVFTNLAMESEARLGGIESNLSEKYRGLGLEPSDAVSNEWTETIRALDPIQTSYLTEVGNTRVAAMNRSLESLAMQEMAQVADLERLKAQTTSAAQYRYLEQVEQRINSEYETMRQNMMSINLTKISATQSALEFNASMRDRAAARMQQEPDPALRYEAAKEYAAAQGALLHNDPEEFERQFQQSYYGELPDDTIWYEFLDSAVDAVREDFEIAATALSNYTTSVYDPVMNSQIGTDEVTRNTVIEERARLEEEYNRVYELYQTYGGLLEQIEASR